MHANDATSHGENRLTTSESSFLLCIVRKVQHKEVAVGRRFGFSGHRFKETGAQDTEESDFSHRLISQALFCCVKDDYSMCSSLICCL